MKPRILIPAALAAAVALGAPSAYAQHHGRGGEQARSGGGEQRASGGEQRAQPRQQAGGERSGGGSVDRSHPAPSAAPAAPPRPESRGPYAVPRSQVAPRYENRGYENRGYANRGYYGGRGYYARPYYSGRTYYGPRGYYYGHPRVIVPVVPYYRPYYAFRPWFSLGFGIYTGYPVPYPYSYGYPAYVYGYPYPDPYGAYPPAGYPPQDPYGYGNSYPQSAPAYPPQQAPYGSVQAQPPQGSYGGISFEITPNDAAIYVDGAYVGVVRDFGPDHQPLTMTPGNHRIELQANGCQPLSFEVNVQAGQVIPYRGALQPL